MSPVGPPKSAASASILSQISDVRSQITQSQRLLLVTLGMGLATLGIGIAMIQMPWQERRQQLTSHYSEEKERAELLLAIQRQKTETQDMESKFLLEGGATALSSQVSQIAALSGLQIESVTPQPEVPIDPYVRLQIEITATANQTNTLRFLKSIEEHKPLLWVEQMDMGEPPAETSLSLTAQDEKTPFQMREQQKIRLLIGAVSRPKGPE